MSLELEITNSVEHGKRISLSGNLDTDTAPQLQAAIDSSVDATVTNVILDLRNLEFLSSAGLRVIFKTKKTMEGRGGKIFLLNLQPQVRKVFEIIKVMGRMDIFQNVQELDDYLAAMQQQERNDD